jgi:hypothetical protein
MPKGTTKEVALLKGRRLRVTRLDNCGRPVYGDDGQATTTGFVSVSVTTNTNATDEIRITNAAGETILYEASVTELAGFSPEITLGKVDPQMLSLMTGQPVVIDSFGNVVGFEFDTKIKLTQSFALEVWAGAPASADGCAADATGQYGYVLFPFLQGGMLGDFSIENGGISFTLSGAATKDGNAWGNGPYDVQLNGTVNPRLAGPLVQPVKSTTALRVMLTDVAPPAAKIGTRPLLKRTETAITTVTATSLGGATPRNYTIVTIPDPAVTVGVEYDFGDGTWDYVLGGDTTHAYAAAGTYVIQASTNGKIVTTTVVVP